MNEYRHLANYLRMKLIQTTGTCTFVLSKDSASVLQEIGCSNGTSSDPHAWAQPWVPAGNLGIQTPLFQISSNLIKIKSPHFLPIFYWLSPCERSKSAPLVVTSGVNMNTFCGYRVLSKTHYTCLVYWILKIVDWSIYNAFMLTPDAIPKGASLDLPHGDQ